MKKRLETIAAQDGRYDIRAFRFVYDGLGHTLKHLVSKPQHVSGQILCEGLQELALKKWGRLSKLVLNSWNVRTTRDFGEIIYALIENKWMSAQPTDSIEDFNDIYSFQSIFKDQYQP